MIPPPPILYLQVLYGLPKILKANVPLRSILSAIGTCGYKLAKFLVPCLDQITSNNFTVKYSVSSANEIRHLRNGDDTNQFVMASFDVKSLFTNIPLNETIHMGANELYYINNTPFLSFSKNQFLQLLKLAATEIYFMFNQRLCLQTDGCAIGSHLGCSLANVFLCHHEAKWLENCPQNFKPPL